MVDIEYANAYSEVLEILKFISDEDYEKIDKEMIDLFETNYNKEYIFEYDPDKTLDEQNVSKIAKTIIAILFRDYWATDVQREKILAKEKYDLEKIEEEKRSIYNPDNIFKNKEEKTTIENTENVNLPMEIKKESIFRRILNKIIGFFNNK